jgi:hypothetical protein
MQDRSWRGELANNNSKVDNRRYAVGIKKKKDFRRAVAQVQLIKGKGKTNDVSPSMIFL